MTSAVALAALAGVCAAAALVALAGAQRRPAATSRARRSRRGGSLRGSALAASLTRLGRRIGDPGAPRELGDRIAAAGTPLGLRAADVMSIKLAGALLGGLLALPVATALPGRLWVVAVLAAPASGYLAPDVLLARRARARGRAMAREVADVLDLLRVAVQSGLATGRALGEVGRRRRGPLARELRRAAREIELGVPRAAALAALTVRAPVAGVPALTAAIARAERHGAPLAPALEALAAEARAEHARRLRDQAARAAPKIQLVVALVLVPAVMLLVAAALVQTLTGGG